jgi:butyrate kinase
LLEAVIAQRPAQKQGVPAVTLEPLLLQELLQFSGGLAAQERRDIQMIVALWRWSNSCRTAMNVQSMWRRTTGIL